MRPVTTAIVATTLFMAGAFAVPDVKSAPLKTMKASPYQQEVRALYSAAPTVSDIDVRGVVVQKGSQAVAATAKGLLTLSEGRWTPAKTLGNTPTLAIAATDDSIAVVTPDGVFSVVGAEAKLLAPLPAEVSDLNNVRCIAAGPVVLIGTNVGMFRLHNGTFIVDPLNGLLKSNKQINQIAVASDGSIAVAAVAGLFVQKAGTEWEALYPFDGSRSWAPRDVRGVAYDKSGRLWFASPQGVGCFEKEWKLYTGYEGLPYDDFTTVAAGEDGVVWFGTHLGAVRFDGKTWEYRQGLQWLPNDDIRAIAVSPEGNAFFATAQGIGAIERKPMTLAEKANFFEQEIDKYHRRTPLGYVDSVSLETAGDKSHSTQHDSDNDGLWTGMYGAGECFAYAATKSPDAKRRAKAAFDALRFLGTVTQGGTPPALPGFIARSILPTSGRNPNEGKEGEDKRKQERDHLWKIMEPRWPKSADGQWYWKSDTSSDELDGHVFFCARYYDLVADTEEEKQRVRDHILGLVDHLIAHDFDLVDWDGKPTRWARYNPAIFENPRGWWEQRGLNSLEILSYLKTAEHMSGGNPKYRQAYDMLCKDHMYNLNITNPKPVLGPGLGNQSDDEMAFMCFYNLLSYVDNPEQRRMYATAWMSYWVAEQPERNPLFNFMFAAHVNEPAAPGYYRAGPFGDWLEDAVDSLQRYPLDRIRWAKKNSQRKDIMPLNGQFGNRRSRGWLRTGKVLPIDERFVDKWNHDPWSLDVGGNGKELADGASFLLPYYVGLYHGFITE